MKKLIFILSIFSFAGVLVSCNKENNGGSHFRFKIDGASYEANGLLAYGVNFDNYLNFYGVKDNTGTEVCYISAPAGTTPGTYTFNDTEYFAYYTDAGGNAFSSRWGAGTGQVTIEEIDATHAKGTFQFKVYDSATESVVKNITDGEFDVEFR